MLDVAKRTGLLLAHHWHWLIAIYVVGWLARYGALNLAVYVSVHAGGIWGGLVFPLVVLTRMLTFVAMFWVMRRDIVGTHISYRDGLNALVSAVVPIFVLFTAWKVNLEDQSQFTYVGGQRYLDMYRNDYTGLSTKSLEEAQNHFSPTGWPIYLTIAVIFLGRVVLTKYRDRMPAWVQLITLYLQATWLYLLVAAAGRRLFGTPTWIAERQVVIWYHAQREELLAHLPGFGPLWEWTTAWMGDVTVPVLISLTWIAFAGIVFAINPTTTWHSAGRNLLGSTRAEQLADAKEHAAQRFLNWRPWLVNAVRSRGAEIADSIMGIVSSLSDSIRLVLHARMWVVAFYIAAFTGLLLLYPSGVYFNASVSDGLAWRLVALLVGPHDDEWWGSYMTSIRAGLGAVIDPIRVCLVAAMYGHCVNAISREPLRV